jgi:hypothetical protein
VTAEDAPLVVEQLSEVKPRRGGWVCVRDTGKVFIERNGEWVPYVKPATPNLWSLLEDDA